MYYGIGENGLKLRDIAAMTGGVYNGLQPDARVYGISIDSRTISPGELFIAIKGDRFDGHDFIDEALRCGAGGILLTEGNPLCPFIRVKDTTRALSLLAAEYKKLFRAFTVAVTGSVGKTTTKQFISSVLSTEHVTLSTEENYNNEIGLPLTLMKLDANYSAIVLEMGMSGLGEISELSRTAEPDIAVITKIGTSHLEYLGTRENILKAKLEITDGMKQDGILIVNADDELLRNAPIRGRAIHRLTCGIDNAHADYIAENIVEIPGGSTFDVRCRREDEYIKGITIPILGRHNIYNALFAVAVGKATGISDEKIARGLINYQNVAMRQSIYENEDTVFIEDCYNAAPESMAAAFEVLKRVAREHNKKRTVAVLGDMRELGKTASQLHYSVGSAAAKAGVDAMIACGEFCDEYAAGAACDGMPTENIYRIRDASDAEKTAGVIKEALLPDDCVLFKASRAMRFERLTDILFPMRKSTR
ncbi:MAG: UDP-N-acetylmuramoyl-tripeptide--D-alanyl-D-alanine ligase [Clostridia bacterium]|nr:UDP-N-acetylmuramoyl-tripeptide--D-alanyl-D-alanine ligase [Clostridia bacterium]